MEIGIWPRRSADQALLGVFGKDDNGNLNPSHRLVQEELTPIGDLSAGDQDPQSAAAAAPRAVGAQRVTGRAMS